MNSTKKHSHRASIALFFMVFMLLGVVLTAQIVVPTPVPTATAQPTPAPHPKFAVIVVGANHADQEYMHLAFGYTGDRVYSTLKAKLYTDADILYLSWDLGNPDVDDLSTKANISWGLQTWLRNKLDNGQTDDTVVIYFIDHGGNYYGSYYFVPYDSPSYFVYDYELSGWVNTALSDSYGNRNYKAANIVIDTCNSGMLIGPPSTGLDGANRIVVTAANSAGLAYSWWAPPVKWFANRPPDSNGEAIFSYYYLKQILAGQDVQSAFNTAYTQTYDEVVRLATLTYSSERQYPQSSSQHPTPLMW